MISSRGDAPENFKYVGDFVIDLHWMRFDGHATVLLEIFI